MVEDDYIETNNDYDSYLEYLLEKDDEHYEDETHHAGRTEKWKR